MMAEDKFGLRPVWCSILAIYKEFERICKRHSLRFFFAEGNAIGAIRHKGFIPWDDDLDVIMPRPDYEKFKEVCKDELPTNLKFVDWHNTPEMAFTFGKIQECRRDYVEAVEQKVGHMLSNGLYIDILVLNGAPNGILNRRLFFVKLAMLVCAQRYLTLRYSTLTTQKSRLFWVLGSLISRVFRVKSSDVVMTRIEKMMNEVPFELAQFTWREGASWRTTRLLFPRELWKESVSVEFEDIMVPLPKEYDHFLRLQYGEYMKLPPEDRQRPSHSYSYRCAWWLGPTKYL